MTAFLAQSLIAMKKPVRLIPHAERDRMVSVMFLMDLQTAITTHICYLKYYVLQEIHSHSENKCEQAILSEM